MLHLHQAYLSDDLALFNTLLGRTAAKEHDGRSGSYKAIAIKQRNKSDINNVDSQGQTVLHLIAADGRLDYLEPLLDHPSLDVSKADRESGWTALHRALYFGRIGVARAILARYPTQVRELLDAKDAEGSTPFDVYNATVAGVNPARHDTGRGGSDFFSFGSNSNHTLGFSDADDRSFPERVQIRRPVAHGECITKFRPQRVLDAVMAKFHTLVLTDDPRSNLYTCGFSNNGRLGVDVSTQFLLKPIGIDDRFVAIAASQDHSLAVSAGGELYSWGSNRHGQLGYDVEGASKEPHVVTPRKVIKLGKERVIGVATSPVHSIAFTESSLWTWGLNEGQLGYEIPPGTRPASATPRKVTSLSSPVVQATATRHATACLLEGGEVLVLTSFGYFKLPMQFDRFSSQYSVFRPRRAYEAAKVTKVVSGSKTIAVLTNFGDVFAFVVDETSLSIKPSVLAKTIKLQRVWSLRKKHLAVRDFDVAQEGDILMCTESGSVFLRSKRNTKQREGAAKEFKVTMVPRITRITAVRASETGAFGLIRDDVTPMPIPLEATNLADDLLCILPYAGQIVEEDEESAKPKDENEDGSDAGGDDSTQMPSHLRNAIAMLRDPDFETAWDPAFDREDLIFVVGEARVPAHLAVCCARSPILKAVLLRGTAVQGITVGLLDGARTISFLDIDLRSVIVVLHYIYTDLVLQTWSGITHRDIDALKPVQNNVKRLAILLGLKHLSKAMTAGFIVTPKPSLAEDIARLRSDSSLLGLCDTRLKLADGATIDVHSPVVASRSEFFAAMFEGAWVNARRNGDGGLDKSIEINLQHIDSSAMGRVIRHIYHDEDLTIFDDLDVPELDDYLEAVIRVLAVATELMLPRLREACQSLLRDKMHRKNVGAMLYEADLYSAEPLKEACLDYCAKNLSLLMQNGLLGQLSHALVHELELDVQRKQIARLPVSKSGRLLSEVIQRHPSVLEESEAARKRYIDSLLVARTSPVMFPSIAKKRHAKKTPASSPALQASRVDDPAIFNMDDYDLSEPPTPVLARRPSAAPSPIAQPPKSPDLQMAFSPLPTRSPAGPASLTQAQRVPSSSPSVRAQQTTRGWGATSAAPVTSLRSVMDQGVQQSALSTSVSASRAAAPATPAPIKVSQRERKASAQAEIVTPAKEQSRRPSAGSPWALKSASPAASLTSIIAAEAGSPSSNPRPASRQPALPSPRPTVTKAVPETSLNRALAQQNGRQPLPSPGRQSLAQIIAQEEGVKTQMAAYTAKRSMKEIQEQEEFERWFAAESERMRKDEAAARALQSTEQKRADKPASGKGKKASQPTNGKSRLKDSPDSKRQPNTNTNGQSSSNARKGKSAAPAQIAEPAETTQQARPANNLRADAPDWTPKP